MKREFEILYRNPTGLPMTMRRIAEDADQVRDEFIADGFTVIGITEVRAVVDWDKPVWDLEEFAAVMNIKGGTLSGKKADGKIPWSSVVNGVPRRVAMRYIENTLNGAGKDIVSELAAA